MHINNIYSSMFAFMHILPLKPAREKAVGLQVSEPCKLTLHEVDRFDSAKVLAGLSLDPRITRK